MKRGRKSRLQFGLNNADHMDMVATRANNMGIYTVESLMSGIYYFFEDDECVVAGTNGHVKMTIETAEKLAEELAAIITDVRENDRTPMSSKAIGQMLERDI